VLCSNGVVFLQEADSIQRRQSALKDALIGTYYQLFKQQLDRWSSPFRCVDTICCYFQMLSRRTLLLNVDLSVYYVFEADDLM